VTIQVIQHTSAEYLGLMEDHLEGRSIRFRYCRPFTGSVSLPKPQALDEGLILLGGGPWGSAGERDVPTLGEEVALARACLDREVPIVGIGLGAQILALAAGGASESSPLELSVGKARRIKADALAGYLPEEYPLVVYGRDRAILPPGAQVLAIGVEQEPALWQLGRNALGFCGHPGIKVAMVEDLVMEFEEAPEAAGEGLAKLRAVQRTIEDALVPIMAGVVAVAGWKGFLAV
jgi:GMP synthase-like glutamine amidotransferase